MATFEYSVTGQSITTTKAGRLVSGTIGIYTVKFTFDSSWDGLEKWASFDPNPGQPYKQLLNANGECLIPGEVMGGEQLRIGAFGKADGQAYPTVWANKLSLDEGCFIEIPMSDWPEPAPVIEEILEELENKVDKPVSATAGNVAIFGSNENIADSGLSKNDVLMSPQLTSHIYAEDKTPYLYRQTGGGVEAGTREYDSIVGGSVVHNQMFQRPNPTTLHGVTVTAVDSVTVTLSGTATSNMYLQTPGYRTVANHVYLARHYISTPGLSLYIYNDSGGVTSTEAGAIGKATASKVVYVRISSGVAFGNGVTLKGQLIDLTERFGTAVADRLYAMEQASAEAGIAVLNAMGLNQYRPCTAEPSLLSSMPTAHKTVGFNRFDLKWFADAYPSGCRMEGDTLIATPITVLYSTGIEVDIDPSASGAYISAEIKAQSVANVRIRVVYADGTAQETNSVNGSDFLKVSANLSAKKIKYVRLNWASGSGAFIVRNLCINLSDPLRNGTYEPYTEHTYPLAGIELRGVSAVDSAGNIYFDGDTYAPDGTVVRRYGIVDLGTLNWIYASAASDTRFYTTSIDCNAPTSSAVTMKAVCALYATVPYDQVNGQLSNDMVMGAVKLGSTVYFAIKNLSYTSAAAFKTAMSGVYMIYELATPTVETAAPYDALQVCDPLGTEEYVDERAIPIPVGHVTKYPVDQVRKLDGLPSDFTTLLAYKENEFKATRTYTKYDFITINNVLYEVTATTIASGTTLTIGSNITQTTVGNVLKQILSSI